MTLSDAAWQVVFAAEIGGDRLEEATGEIQHSVAVALDCMSEDECRLVAEKIDQMRSGEPVGCLVAMREEWRRRSDAED